MLECVCNHHPHFDSSASGREARLVGAGSSKLGGSPSPPSHWWDSSVCWDRARSGQPMDRERERKEGVVNCKVMQLLLFTSCSELCVCSIAMKENKENSLESGFGLW